MAAVSIALVLALAPDLRAGLAAAATSSPRPAECASPTVAQAPELWGRARSADRGSYCVALAKGHTRLARSPAEALELATRALELLPQSRAATVLRARALVRLGRGAEGWALVAPLLAAGKPGVAANELLGVDDPIALRDLAAAAVSAGADVQAHELFRVIAARASLLPDARLRATVLLETAVLALARGPEFLGQAELYLDEARRHQVPGLRDLVQAFTALALDRAGRAEQSRAAAREASGPWTLERRAESLPDLVLPSGELSAAIAVLAEGRDARVAESGWRTYLADARAGKGPWAAHAQSKLSPAARGRAR
jgi:hypothetical protein